MQTVFKYNYCTTPPLLFYIIVTKNKKNYNINLYWHVTCSMNTQSDTTIAMEQTKILKN